jgi:multiple sugar transport system substrate-binding protein
MNISTPRLRTNSGGKKWRTNLQLGAGLVAVSFLAASCSGGPTGSSGSTESGAGAAKPASSITSIDYFTDATSSAAFQKVLSTCATKTGIKINRQSLPLKELLPKVLQGASSGTMPNLAFVDNVNVQQLAQTGALTPISNYGFDLSGFAPGIVAATTLNGKNYGVSPAINTLALFYNKDMFAAAGLKPPTTWDELKTDAAALKTPNRYGLALSAPASEEGTWQFLPFFWSNGGDLTNLTSPKSVEALSFITSLVKDGSMSQSVVNWAQADVADQFIAGNTAMMINGPWNISKIDKSGKVKYGIVPIPVPKAGATLTVPLGGEVGVIPVSGGSTQAAAAKVLKCMTDTDQMLQWAMGNTRIAPRDTTAKQEIVKLPVLAPFAETVRTSRARTTGLGLKYPVISQALWTAIQSALTSTETPEAALKTAQTTVDSSAK